jgi:hypothetical protein
MSYRIIALIAVLLPLLCGCASDSTSPAFTSPPPEKTKSDVKLKSPLNGDRESAATRFIDVTPFTQLSDAWDEKSGSGAMSDSYTRLIIQSSTDMHAAGSTGEVVSYPYRARPWLDRFFVGKDYGINFTAKVTVGPFEATAPLLTLSHQSNRSVGERWERVVYHSIQNFPLFLVKGNGENSIAVARFSVKGSEELQSRIAASAVQVALNVARAVAPEAAVVTRLSQQSSKDKAQAIDNAVGKLFGVGISEENWSDRDMRRWKRDGGVSVTLKIPENEGDWGGEKLATVGTWTIAFDDPRPSIFSDWRICSPDVAPRCADNRAQAITAVHGAINAASVLSFSLVDNGNTLGTIRSYLAQQDWYASAQTELAGANAAAAAGLLCRRIRNSITEMSLNGVDADIVVWAVAKGMPLPSGAADAMRASPDCNSVAAIDKVNGR